MPDIVRYTFYWKTTRKSVFCYMSVKDIVKKTDGTIDTGAMDALVSAIEGMTHFDVFAVTARESTRRPYSPRPLKGVWYKSATFIFETADAEYYSFRIPVVDEKAAFFKPDMTVDETHPSVAAFVTAILTAPITFTDARGVPLVAFVGGCYGIDLTQLQQ